MTNTYLSQNELLRLTPSIFSEGAAHDTSSRYGFIPTIKIVEGLAKAGFFPVCAQESRCRTEEKRPFVKHLLRFRNNDMAANYAGVFPEIVLVNSHDRTSSYQLRAGFYRLACCNGLIVGDEIYCRKVRHSGDIVGRVVEAGKEIIDILPESVETIEEWKNIELSPDRRLAYAQAAAALKWDEESSPVNPVTLIKPRRSLDSSEDLWTTFNVVQENLMKGGIRYRSAPSGSNIGGRRNRTRSVSSVAENSRLNTALWMLTKKMAELV